MKNGSLFIHETNPGDLLDLPPDLEESDAYDFVRMEATGTSDFQKLAESAGAAWAVGPPVCFDVSTGGVIRQVSPDGLLAVRRLYLKSLELDGEDELGGLASEQRCDLESLVSFIDDRGTDDIYELTA